jgi:four helix bundle protein
MKGDNIAARLIDFAARVLELLKHLEDTRAGRHVSEQLLRAATSGGSNYEEARSAQSRRDFVHKVSLAAKEMRESLYWLGLIQAAHLAPQDAVTPLLQEGSELVAILMSSAKTAKEAEQAHRSRSPVRIPGSDAQLPAPGSQPSAHARGLGSRARDPNRELGAGHQSGEYERGTGNGRPRNG